MRKHRNPLYAPEYLERKLSPSGFLDIPVPTVLVAVAPVPVADLIDPPPPPPPDDPPPIVPAGPDVPA
jgi:hypothetical protein